MKKFLSFFLIVFAVFAYTESASAQLNVKAVVEKKPERLLTCHMSYCYLYHSDHRGYEYWASSDNQFDRKYTTLFLGNTPDEAVKTLNDLQGLIENQTAGVSVAQPDGDVVLTFAKQLGYPFIWIHQDGQAGKSWINSAVIDKMRKYFEENFPALNENSEAEPQTTE